MSETLELMSVDLPQLVRLLSVAQPIMEAWAKSHELDEWHCRCEDMIGTAYPRNLCPVCCVESSINWRDGKPYYYCPDHGELDDLYSEPNAERIHGGAGLPKQSKTPTPLDGATSMRRQSTLI